MIKKRQKFRKEYKNQKKENRTLRAEIRENKHKIIELKKYVEKISLMFKSETEETAMKRFQKLNDKNRRTT